MLGALSHGRVVVRPGHRHRGRRGALAGRKRAHRPGCSSCSFASASPPGSSTSTAPLDACDQATPAPRSSDASNWAPWSGRLLAIVVVLIAVPSRTDLMLGVAGGGLLSIASFYAIRASVDAVMLAMPAPGSGSSAGHGWRRGGRAAQALDRRRDREADRPLRVAGPVGVRYDCAFAPASTGVDRGGHGARRLGHRRSGPRARPDGPRVIARNGSTFHARRVLIVTLTNRLLGGLVASLAQPLGYHLDPAHAIPTIS